MGRGTGTGSGNNTGKGTDNSNIIYLRQDDLPVEAVSEPEPPPAPQLPAENEVLLALEASTSSAKAMLYHPTRGVVKVHTLPYPAEVGDVVSLNPEGVYETLTACVREILGDGEWQVKALGLCGIWHSLLLLDRNDHPIGPGSPERPMTTWANTDAARLTARAREDRALCHKLYQRTGCMAHGMYPLWQFRSWRARGGDDRKVARLCSQPDYLFERLTGEWASSRSVASGSGLLNIHSLDWDAEVIRYAGIKRAWLPRLCEPEYAAPLTPEAARELGLPAGLPVVIGGPDGALNQLGGGCVGAGLMTFSVGTSGALRLSSAGPLLPDNPSTWCYYLAEGRRIIGAATSGAGNCVDWFVKSSGLNQGGFAALSAPLQRMCNDPERRAAAPYFLPFMYGERCPGWQEQRRGGFLELRGQHEVGDLYYALLEGVLFNLYQNYEILAAMAGEPGEIHISGGIVKDALWLQMAADLWQKPLLCSHQEHSSTMGVVALMLKQQKYIAQLKDFAVEPGERIRPRSLWADCMRTRYQRYLQLYRGE